MNQIARWDFKHLFMLNLNYLKPILLFFAIAFSLTALAQYFYVKYETMDTEFKLLEESAKDLNRAIGAKNGVINLEEYVKAVADVGGYYVVLSDGTILDKNPVDTHGISSEQLAAEINTFIPPVSSPVLNAHSYDNPYTESFDSQFIGHTKWRILAKKLKGGIVILGLSQSEHVDNFDQLLVTNMARFGSTLDDARKVKVGAIDDPIGWALIDDSGRLLNGFAVLPLKTNFMLVGATSTPKRVEKVINSVPFIALYYPIEDLVTHSPIGTMILPESVGLINQSIDSLAQFSIGVSGISFLLFILVTLILSTKQERDKRQIREAFQNYFSPKVMEAILRDPDRLKLGGERREITILFSDIRGFTALSEKLPPQQMTQILQEYFNEMTEEVLATDGIVDKYIGDAIMAFWGAPLPQHDQADRAVTTAINMVKRLKVLHEKWRSEGLPEFDMGIGINLGVATVGNLGSAKRFDYTVVGDAVNAASRIESLNKKYASNIIISESTKAQLTINLGTEDLGEVLVPGKEVPIRIYRVKNN